MNWDAVGAIAELLGAVAVVGTLAYLATQIRQSNLSSRVAARLEMTRQYADYADVLINNSDANRIYRSGVSGEHLDEGDSLLFSTLMHKCFWYFSAMYYQYSAHSLSEDEWHQSKSAMIRIASPPGVKAWWEIHHVGYSPSFVEFVRKEIYGEESLSQGEKL